MDNKTLFFEEHALFNVCGLDLICYYDPKTNVFEVQYRGHRVRKSLIETPYIESYKPLIWRKFWSSLNDNELRLAESFDERRGFFGFLRETGLISRYDAAVELSKLEIIEHWERENGLSIDWTTVAVK